MNKIITHNGKGHQDDFLATCVCVYKLNCSAFRVKEATKEQLESPNFWVIDQGNRHQPELHNFDHHHLKEEICSFTMILDYFYKQDYREYLPQLKFIEIADSYGIRKAAQFFGINQDKIEIVNSPISTSIIRIFSKIEGEITNPIYSIMLEIGKDICEKIENSILLINCLNNSKYFEFEKFKILDVTSCNPPENFNFDVLPTKLYCKKNNLIPEIILTKDTRQNGYRMISINTDSLRFLPNEKSYFTHVSGILTNFTNYEDYKFILSEKYYA